MKKTQFVLMILVTACAVFTAVSGCKSDAQTGAGVGALAGAGIGQLAGRSTEATLIGAAVGGGAGYMIGNERDKNKTKNEMDDLRAEMNQVSVNITNSNGSVSQVKLTRQGTGYTGPKGEFYDHIPTEQELKQAGYGF